MHKSFAIIATHPTIVTVRDDIGYDANDNVVEYDDSIVQAYITTNSYKDLRAAEYPSYGDQFDTIFHEGIDAWKAQIQAVKDKYPKV